MTAISAVTEGGHQFIRTSGLVARSVAVQVLYSIHQHQKERQRNWFESLQADQMLHRGSIQVQSVESKGTGFTLQFGA